MMADLSYPRNAGAARRLGRWIAAAVVLSGIALAAPVQAADAADPRVWPHIKDYSRPCCTGR